MFQSPLRQVLNSLDEDTDQFRIKLRTGTTFQFLKRRGWSPCLLIDSVRGNGVVGVGNSDDARAYRYLIPHKAGRIARAVEHLVVMANHLPNVGDCAQAEEGGRNG